MIEETNYQQFIRNTFMFNHKFNIGDNVRFLMYRGEVVSYNEFKDKDIKDFYVDEFEFVIGKIKGISCRGINSYTIESYNFRFKNDNYIVTIFEDALSYLPSDNNDKK